MWIFAWLCHGYHLRSPRDFWHSVLPYHHGEKICHPSKMIAELPDYERKLIQLLCGVYFRFSTLDRGLYQSIGGSSGAIYYAADDCLIMS